MNNQPIGILDSGVGGLSIWQEIMLKLPQESTVYLADSLNCPYGKKTKKEVYKLAKRMVRFLIKENVKLIVLACNTITVSCLDILRKDFPEIPIVGTVPVVKTASQKTKNKKIGILSTITTAKSSYQKNLINKFAVDCRVLNLGTSVLVPFVEKAEIKNQKIETELRKILLPFEKAKIDVLALGCSHFPFLRKQIQKILGSKVLLLDSGAAIARQVERVLLNRNELSKGKNVQYKFYTTGDKKQFGLVVEKLIGEEIFKMEYQILNINLEGKVSKVSNVSNVSKEERKCLKSF